MLRKKTSSLSHELLRRRCFSSFKNNDSIINRLNKNYVEHNKHVNVRMIRISNKNDKININNNNKYLLSNSRKRMSSSSSSSSHALIDEIDLQLDIKEGSNKNIIIDKNNEMEEWKKLNPLSTGLNQQKDVNGHANNNTNGTTGNENVQQLWKNQVKKIKNIRESFQARELPALKQDENNIKTQKSIIEKKEFLRLLQLYDEIKQQEASLLLLSMQEEYACDEAEDVKLLSEQIWNECEAQREWIDEYEAIYESAVKRKDFSSLPPVKKCLLSWYTPLRDAIEAEQALYYTNAKGGRDRVRYGAYLCLVQPEKLAVITAHECTNHALEHGGSGATLAAMSYRIGGLVEAEVNVQRLLFRKFVEKKKDKVDNDATTTTTGAAATTTDNIDDDDNKQENIRIKLEEKMSKWTYTPTHLQTYLDEIDQQNSKRKRARIIYANRRAQKVLEEDEPWSTSTKVKLGSALINMLITTAHMPDTNPPVPAFTHEKRWISYNKLVGHIAVHEDFYQMTILEKNRTVAPYTTRFQPMVIPPLPWKKWTQYKPTLHGAYYVLNSEFMRTRGCLIQQKALPQADLSTVMQGLNYLGCIPWRINNTMLQVAHKCWDNNIVLGDIPSIHDYIVPPKPDMPAFDPNLVNDIDEQDEELNNKKIKQKEEYIKYRDLMLKHKRLYQRNMDLRSLRSSFFLKLNQGDKFASSSKLYFPYNLDFRGRAYPIPPHLSNVGSDLCRSFLTFEKKKPLGERGLFWLFVHLANLVGQDKISFEERYKYTEDHLEDIYASVKQPISSDIKDKSSWWRREPDDPFQALATCNEIVNALECGHDPTLYESSLPVHMDGSCNGLQHYAALGRDPKGGFAVNLCSNVTSPQDVYSGVMEKVIQRVEEHTKLMDDKDLYQKEKERILAAATENKYTNASIEKEIQKRHKAANLVHGLIDRGVVKRTVMTSVYGVTPIGARKQIKEKVEEKLKEKGLDIDDIENEIHNASGYLAAITMDAIGQLFIGAKETMNWLTTCARLITTQEHPVAWVSPIGVPIVQPYRQSKAFTVITLLQRLVLTSNSDNLPIHKMRQVSAFPPNYVHSLDSSHMILTANEMEKRGLTFSAVHDSFWTHACDIDEMNGVLRQTFVELYDKPLLEELKSNWEMRYPGITFPDIPEKGNLDLKEVLNAPYFFQ